MKTKFFFPLVALAAFSGAACAAEFEQTVNDLIPRLADPNVPARYPAQMELQDLASKASAPGREADRAALSRLLATKASDPTVPQPARVWIVRQLEYIGRGEAVPALTQLLSDADAELRECARRALEKNPDPGATASLRTALEKAAEPKWRIGLIHSLGEKRDPAAVQLISRHLPDPAVGWAAAKALGNIATPAAVEALWSVFGQNRFAPEALVEAANRLAANGQTAPAKAIAQRLWQQDPAAPTRRAALVVMASLDPAAATPWITDALTSSDLKLQQAALTAALGAGLTQTVGDLLPRLSAAAKVQALALLPATAEPQILAVVNDADESVRRAALEALGRVGSGASVPALLAAATDETRPGKSTAAAALARINGPGAAQVIRQAASQADPKRRAAAITALAARRDTSALGTLLVAAALPDPDVSRAAWAGLGQMGTEAELEMMARLAVRNKPAEAADALQAVASRVTDKPTAARKLLAVAGTDPQAQAVLLPAFSALGGPEALDLVVKLTSNSDPQIRDQALRALGDWLDLAAAKPLLAIAKNPNTPLNQYAAAMQGVARLIKTAETEPAEARIEVATAALAAARRNEEKKLLLSAVGSVPDARAATVIQPLLSDPNLKREAGAAALNLAEVLRRTDRKTARALAQAVKDANISETLNQRADRLLSR
jgi:HEAT repeat protein